MVRITYLILVLTIGCQIVNADEPRRRSSFHSGNDKYEARLNDGQWKLIDKATGQELYQFSKLYGQTIRFSSMTLLISNDGKSVVAIDDYSEQDFRENPDVLFFMHDGVKTRSYKLNDILENTKYVSISISHFSWVNLKRPFAIIEDKVSFETYKLTSYVFDSKTGEMLKKEPDRALTEDSAYVYGDVRWLGDDRFEVKIACVLHGNGIPGSTIAFTSGTHPKWKRPGNWESLIIREGKLVNYSGVLFNVCSSDPK